MGLKRNVQTTAAVVIFAAVGASCFAQAPQQNTYDPYNPQTQRQPNNMTMNPVLTSTQQGNLNNNILNHGSGTDEGNIGPFVTMGDKQFAQMTATRSLMELQLSQAAVEKGSTEGVRQLGRRMVEDYTKWSNGMTRAAAHLKIEIPTELDAKHQAETDRVLALSGAAFDEAYLRAMVHLQNKALTITHYEATNASVSGFRNWAGVILPTIQEHLKMAKQEQNGGEMLSRK
jgi:putative membrane protein